MKHYYLKGHDVVIEPNFTKWAKEFEKGTKKVARTVIKKRFLWIIPIGEVLISTVFLGLDCGFGEGSPQIFETMVFGGNHDSEQKRYATWNEAEKGHQEMVNMV